MQAINTISLTEYRQEGRRIERKKWENLFEQQLREAKVLPWKREYKFAPGRKYAADFAWPDQKILCEIEGGIWSYGRHNRAVGFNQDLLKYNLAAELGYRVFRFNGMRLINLEDVCTIARVVGTKI